MYSTISIISRLDSCLLDNSRFLFRKIQDVQVYHYPFCIIFLGLLVQYFIMIQLPFVNCILQMLNILDWFFLCLFIASEYLFFSQLSL